MGIFTRKAINPTDYDPRNPQRKQVDQFLSEFVSRYGSAYTPQKAYEGNFTAGMSPFERRGIDEFLPQYLNAPNVSPELGNVRGLLQKTINGGFDPGTSEYYQALRDTAEYNRKGAKTNLRADLGARGKFFSSEAVQKEGDIDAQTANSLNLSMADLADKERNRSMAAVPYATSLEDYIAKVPLQKTAATQSYGSLSRLLEQNDLEALYQDFLRKQDEGKGAVNAASGVSSTQMQQSYQAYEPSTFERYIMPLLKAGIAAAGASAGGAAGAGGGAGASGFSGGGGF